LFFPDGLVACPQIFWFSCIFPHRISARRIPFPRYFFAQGCLTPCSVRPTAGPDRPRGPSRCFFYFRTPGGLSLSRRSSRSVLFQLRRRFPPGQVPARFTLILFPLRDASRVVAPENLPSMHAVHVQERYGTLPARFLVPRPFCCAGGPSFSLDTPPYCWTLGRLRLSR